MCEICICIGPSDSKSGTSGRTGAPLWKLLPAPEVVCVCWTVRAEMFARELSEVISVLEYTELSCQMCINQYARSPSASYIRTNLCPR